MPVSSTASSTYLCVCVCVCVCVLILLLCVLIRPHTSTYKWSVPILHVCVRTPLRSRRPTPAPSTAVSPQQLRLTTCVLILLYVCPHIGCDLTRLRARRPTLVSSTADFSTASARSPPTCATAAGTTIYVCMRTHICVSSYILCMCVLIHAPPPQLIRKVVGSSPRACALASAAVYVSAYSYICVLIRLYMCPHTTIYVSSNSYIMCVLILLYMCPQNPILCVSSYYYIRVLILLYICSHTTI